MASCQQYEEKLPCPQGQIVRVSCLAHPHLSMGVVDGKKVRILEVTQTWLKEGIDKAFILLQAKDHDELVDIHKVVKGVGTDKKDPNEVALDDIHKVDTWTESRGEGCWSHISRANPIDGKVWTAMESCDGIKIMLRPIELGNPKQFWNIQTLTPN